MPEPGNGHGNGHGDGQRAAIDGHNGHGEQAPTGAGSGTAAREPQHGDDSH
jgi:hypothetical protein